MGQQESGHVTLSHIARACQLSVSTVSIVLSGAPLSRHVAEKTRKRIQTTARRLGYHPDAYARSLRSRRTQTIGVIAYDMSDPFCIPVVSGIDEGLQPAQYFSLLVNAQTQRKLFDKYLRMILERRAEGVIVVASWVFEETDLLADIEKNHVPIVIVGRDLTERRITSVLVDNRAGGALMMRHLASLGHRNIAVIRGPEELFDSAPRWAGIRQAATEAGIRFDSRLVSQLPNLSNPKSGFEGGRKFVAEILATGRKFTAVLAFDDLTALGVVRGLVEAGLSVPEDCSVVGFDDILPADVATPGITTIRQPLHEMGLLATELMLHALKQGQGEGAQEAGLRMVQPELVVRTSSAAPGGGK
ncbi:MAG TPA: LacI family DNA-binding transcriptional regulator [Acidobacteriaceae bacterium]|nr:LacI family DNA-binding transcriptional regulator [Acidobacteriaceae bacterium]